jgi:hypothetical protein
MSPASGFLHEFQVSGGTEFAAEIAGITGVNVNYIGCPQGQCVFQFQPVVNVNAGNLFGFHRKFSPWCI